MLLIYRIFYIKQNYIELSLVALLVCDKSGGYLGWAASALLLGAGYLYMQT
jgi:hypothetical protein